MASVGLTLLLIQQWSLLLPELPDSTALWVGLPFALAGLWYQALKGLAVIYLLAFAQLEALSALPNPREIVARDHALVRVEGQIMSVIRDQGEFLSYQLKVKRAADPALVGHQLIIADRHLEHLKTLKSAVSLDATVQLRSLAGHVNIHPRHDQMSTFYRGVTGRASMIMMHPVEQGRRMVSPLPIRQKFSDWVNKEVKDPRARSVIKALTVGRNDFLSSGDQWLLQKTATAHLLVISGLHMTLVGWGSFRGLRYFGFSYRISLMAGSAAAMFYAWLATGGVSVIRSGLMLGFLMAAGLFRFPRSGWGIFWLTFVLTLLVSPTISGLTGFWFSFGCVASLLTLARIQGEESLGLFFKALLTIRMQLLLGLLMLPVVTYFIGVSSLIGPLVNVIAIPFVALFVLPASIIVLLMFLLSELLQWSWFQSIARFSLEIAEFVVMALWFLLDWAGTMAQLINLPALPVVYLVLLAAGLCIVFSGLKLGHWTLVLALCCPLMAPKVNKPKLGALKLLVMDVGQGTSVLIQTANHYLLFDAGPKTRYGFDAGAKVVLPQLRGLGVSKIHQLIISHSDADHAGGRAVIDQRFRIEGVTDSSAQACLQGHAFDLDEITFRYSRWQQAQTQNDGSCQLSIEGLGYKILLAGDIGAEAEVALLPDLPRGIDLLLAPHHGSRSSSSPALLNQLMPKWVVFSMGLDNAFGHPHPEIVTRYSNRGSRLLFTGQQGAVEFAADHSGIQLRSSARSEYARFWLASQQNH